MAQVKCRHCEDRIVWDVEAQYWIHEDWDFTISAEYRSQGCYPFSSILCGKTVATPKRENREKNENK